MSAGAVNFTHGQKGHGHEEAHSEEDAYAFPGHDFLSPRFSRLWGSNHVRALVEQVWVHPGSPREAVKQRTGGTCVRHCPAVVWLVCYLFLAE